MAIIQFPGTDFHDLNLDWVLQQVKNLLTEWASTKEEWETLKGSNEAFVSFITAQWDDFKSYVENYLANLPISDEISAKINAMIDDGTFLELLVNPAVPGEPAPLNEVVEGWLNTHIHEGYAVDDTLTKARAAADAKATGDAITDLRSALENIVDDTLIVTQLGNIYQIAFNKITGKYYNRASDNTLSQNTNASWAGFIVKIYPGNTYEISVASNIVLLNDSREPINQTGLGWDAQNTTSFQSSTATYVAVSYKTADVVGSLVMSEGTTLDSNDYSESYENIVICDDTFSSVSTKPIQNKVITNRIEKINSLKTPYDSISDSISAGGQIELTKRSAIKDGEIIIFKAVLESFTSLKLAFMGYSGTITNYVEVSASNISVKNNTSSATTTAHGLTIQNDITLMVEFIEGNAKITLVSNGYLYTQTVKWSQTNGLVSCPRVISTDTVCTSATLKTIYNGIKRKIWYFGDSYIQFNSNTRFPYYLNAYGYDKNALFTGASGGASATVTTSFQALLNYGTPTFAVFATGMNDGGDTNSETPNSSWVTAKNNFLTYCQNNNITPVFATIPTVPSVNNEGKNAWIRNSGYRYIDFAKAVGAQSNGTWYEGMLSNDSVHPSEYGAKALFSQLMLDLPEIAIN